MKFIALSFLSFSLLVYGNDQLKNENILELVKSIPQIQLQIVHVVSMQNQSLHEQKHSKANQSDNFIQNRSKRDQKIQIEQVRKILKDDGNGKQFVMVEQKKGPVMSQIVKVEQFKNQNLSETNVWNSQNQRDSMPQMHQPNHHQRDSMPQMHQPNHHQRDSMPQMHQPNHHQRDSMPQMHHSMYDTEQRPVIY